MIFTPIFDRELRVRARQSATYWSRCLAGGVASLLAVQSAIGYATVSTPAALGIAIFDSLSWLGFFVASAFGIATADCLSSERRGGTLGLLFLSGVRPGEVVRGKLAIAAISGFYGLMGALPALAIGMLMGGITGSHLFRTSLALLNMLFVSAAVGTWASSREQNQIRSAGKAVLTVAALLLTPLTGFWAISPYWPFYRADDVKYLSAPHEFWASLLFSHLLGWGFMVMATRSLTSNWGEGEAEPDTRSRRFWKFTRKKKDFGQQIKWLLETDPVCWVSRRLHEHNHLIWVGVFLMILVGPGWSILFSLSGPSVFGFAGAMSFAGLVPNFIFAWLTGKYFLEARSSGELELLLSTPLGGRDIVGGRWRALIVQFRGPLLLAGFAEFLAFVVRTNSQFGSQNTGALQILSLVLWPLNRILDVVAVAWVAMWFGLKSRRPRQLILWPVILVQGIPMALWYTTWHVVVRTALLRPSGPLLISVFFGFALPLLLVGKNIVFIKWAAWKLQREFRAAAPIAVGGWFETEEDLVAFGAADRRLVEATPGQTGKIIAT
jgi:hypothetical protein